MAQPLASDVGVAAPGDIACQVTPDGHESRTLRSLCLVAGNAGDPPMVPMVQNSQVPGFLCLAPPREST